MYDFKIYRVLNGLDRQEGTSRYQIYKGRLNLRQLIDKIYSYSLYEMTLIGNFEMRFIKSF